jgi:hypothetical protein
MKLIKLIVPTGLTLIAAIALCAACANAQTMGEYSGTTAGAGSGGSSMGTALSTSVDNSSGAMSSGSGSSTWGASGVGGSFDDRAGAETSFGGGDFDSRAGSSSSSASGDSRFPASPFDGQSSSGGLGGDSADRFADSSGRFADTDRFSGTSELSDSSDRFPTGSLDDHQGGLDTEYNAVNNF